MRAAWAVGALALAVLAGCTSSEKEATPGTGAGSVTTAAGPTTTVRPVDTSFSGQNSEQFCALAKTYNSQVTNVGANQTAAQLKTTVESGRTAINAAAAAAPPEIKPDVQVLADALGTLFTELEKVNFDPTKVSLSAFASLQTPQFQASTTRFQAYLRSVCGVTG